MLQMLKIITLNDMPRFYKSLFWTSVAELAKFSTIFVVIYFVARVLGPFFACVPLAVVILWATRRLSDYLSTKHIDAVLDASNHINEYIDGITTIKAHSLSGEKFKRLERSFENLRKESIKIKVGLMPFVLAVVSCMGAGIGLMIGFGREFLLRGELSVIEYLGFILVGSKAFVSLMTFAINFIELRYFTKSGQNILALRAQREVSGSDRQIPQGNDIVIENLCFSYGARGKNQGEHFENVQENGKQDLGGQDFSTQDLGVEDFDKQILERQDFALRDINLTIPHKSSLAIVGESGSGKSTLVKLIARFYEPSSGAIKIGNASKKASLKNIAHLEIESLMAKFSMVFQNPYLFGGSVKSNVAFGKEDASDEEIEEALKSANALEFVNALPYGIDTKVSESGASLSGGERQRISIARCNLKNSPIILLDEITSSLDVYNEFAMQRALNRLAKDKTIIIIAHKLKSVMNCDKIVFLKNGKIVESGTHTELLALEGEYAKMWSAQNLG